MPKLIKVLAILAILVACEAPPVCDPKTGKCYHAPVLQEGTNPKEDNGFFFWFYLGFFLTVAASNPGRRGRF